ncbi:hypothetical protein L1987_68416 [Smallanthus sonchifolius]|uniref:Uncharacterized protein n=1 Tax=Smallanthus sonchifolius TaxID=185202 RepID=A0ACB9B3J3_9ASTR|nr:hypothetical protein L1987_68416 [Smallanthus sonchifolius]
MEVNGAKNHETGLVKLKCSVQNYDWGQIGYDSQVARLFERNCGCWIEEKKRYAEFWIGTHVSGQSVLLGSDNVLSVGRSLSIQTHPDKELAGLLHKLQPNTYKDSNHKPEMALALTEFEALSGFISSEIPLLLSHGPWVQFWVIFQLMRVYDAFAVLICYIISYVPEIKEVVGNACDDQILTVNKHNGEVKERVLRSILTKLMSVNCAVISKAISGLINRLSRENESRQLTSKEELVLNLEKQYPNDVGVLASLLLNHVKLEPGDALYIATNKPHAYLKGECIECMAASDNVVRAGLTP